MRKPIPKYVRHKARNCGKVTIHRKTHYLPGEFNSEESKTAYGRLPAEYLTGQAAPDTTNVTLRYLSVQYMKYCKEYYVDEDGKELNEVRQIRLSLKPLLDLFDIDHAEKVLVKFGQAFGRLPAQTVKLTDDEQSFVQSVVSGLAQDGKVVSVRLALFAEMVKGKPWVSTTLEEVGGTEGIGVNFLEETFSSRTANPKHRLHQQAAREVLKALLPEAGSDSRARCGRTASCWKPPVIRAAPVSSMTCCGFWTGNCG